MIIRTVDQAIGHRPIPKAAPDATVREACYELDRLNAGALVVLEAGRLTGILSERDVIRKCICAGRPSGITRVADIMTPDPVTIARGAALADALHLMLKGGFRHLPVVEGARVRGLLSRRDIPTEYRMMMERYGDFLVAPVGAA